MQLYQSERCSAIVWDLWLVTEQVLISLCLRSGGIILGLDSLKIVPQGTQAFLAVDILPVRQNQTKQLRIGSSNIVDRLL